MGTEDAGNGDMNRLRKAENFAKANCRIFPAEGLISKHHI